MDISLDDAITLQAIGILADSLDEVSGSGILDTVLVSKALRQAMNTKSRPAFDFASRAFSTLDAHVRQQVARSASSKAKEMAVGRRRPLPAAPAPGPAPGARPQKSAPTGLLGAINVRSRGRPGA